ncbi:MAG: carbohydrate ABC transporter permease [Verrucomicrobia bacterium]|nr:carbohydrate ABC transporter permease [Verrucomicrobiota bacterium]MBV9273767.1 carbohydrate ABC transporter permease [Verrucomicrobiota bacterium]
MKGKRFSILGALCTLLTLAMALAWIFPIYWITITSLKTEDQTIVVPPSFFPWPPIFDAFVYVLQTSPFIRWYINTIVVSVTVTFFSILFGLMCGYGLSQLRFPGRNLVYTSILVGFMLPFSALAVPLFMMLNHFKLVNTFPGLILPQIVVPLSVIVFKQFFDDVPRDFRDAALMDGASNWRILFRIYLPLNWNITWAMAIVTFIGTWNNFFWPLIITNSTPMLTIPVGMTQIQLAYGVQFAEICATAVLASIPTAATYILFQKRVTQGVIAVAGIK